MSYQRIEDVDFHGHAHSGADHGHSHSHNDSHSGNDNGHFEHHSDHGHSHQSDHGHSHQSDHGNSHQKDHGHSHQSDHGHSHQSDHGHSHHSDHGHSHGSHDLDHDREAYLVARRKLLCAGGFCFVFMIVEVIGGYIAGSLAIMTDAAHLLSDVAGFAISLFGLYVAQKPTNLEYTYGYQRAEVIGAILSVLMLWFLTGILVYEAINRLIHPSPVDGKIMFIVATLGLFVNVIMGLILAYSGHGHSHGELPGSSHETETESIAVRSALIHVVGDLVQNAGVMCAAGLIWYNPKWTVADPLCTFVFATLVLATTPGILRQGFNILLSAAPVGMSGQIYSDLSEVPCIVDAHDLHIWPLNSSGKLSLTVHVVATDKEKALDAAQSIAKKYEIRHTTIQVEGANSMEVENCATINMHHHNELGSFFKTRKDSDSDHYFQTAHVDTKINMNHPETNHYGSTSIG
eukprot:GSMAST32.ASY1.ANO1.1112.1 assembled CDS